MHTVHHIVKAFGGPSALAAKTGNAQQTVSSWTKRAPPEIPPLHRPIILKVAQKSGVELSADAHAYLKSKQRTPTTEAEQRRLARLASARKTADATSDRVAA